MGETESSGGATTFSQLLFSSSDHHDEVMTLDHHHHHHNQMDLQALNHYYSCSSSSTSPSSFSSPKMLCFGDYQTTKNCSELIFTEVTTASKKLSSGVACMSTDSSSASSPNNGTINNLAKNKRRSGSSAKEPVKCSSTVTETAVVSRRTSKKTKTENPATGGNAKARKEKLGDRITALQQLVSPFGKTDTASVLHEAMGYIRFLQEQVQVLCSPYLHRLPSSPPPEGGETGEESRKDLRSMGLCLVPVASTVHVASSNGADFWSPASGKGV